MNDMQKTATKHLTEYHENEQAEEEKKAGLLTGVFKEMAEPLMNLGIKIHKFEKMDKDVQMSYLNQLTDEKERDALLELMQV